MAGEHTRVDRRRGHTLNRTQAMSRYVSRRGRSTPEPVVHTGKRMKEAFEKVKLKFFSPLARNSDSNSRANVFCFFSISSNLRIFENMVHGMKKDDINNRNSNCSELDGCEVAVDWTQKQNNEAEDEEEVRQTKWMTRAEVK